MVVNVPALLFLDPTKETVFSLVLHLLVLLVELILVGKYFAMKNLTFDCNIDDARVENKCRSAYDEVNPSSSWLYILHLAVPFGFMAIYVFLSRHKYGRYKRCTNRYYHLHTIYLSKASLLLFFFMVMIVLFASFWKDIFVDEIFDCTQANQTVRCVARITHQTTHLIKAYLAFDCIWVFCFLADLVNFMWKWKKNEHILTSDSESGPSTICSKCSLFRKLFYSDTDGQEPSTENAIGPATNENTPLLTDSDKVSKATAQSTEDGVNGSSRGSQQIYIDRFSAKRNVSTIWKDHNFLESIATSLEDKRLTHFRQLAGNLGISNEDVLKMVRGVDPSRDFFANLACNERNIMLQDLKGIIEGKLKYKNMTIFDDLQRNGRWKDLNLKLTMTLGELVKDGKRWEFVMENVADKLVDGRSGLPSWKNVASYYKYSNSDIAVFDAKKEGNDHPTFSLFELLKNKEDVPSIATLKNELKHIGRNDIIREIDEWILGGRG